MILVVEDDAPTRELLAAVLTDEGYSVVAVRTGEEALVALGDAETVQVVLLDLLLPGINGWELRRHMLSDAHLAAIPVLVVSAISQLDNHMAQLGPAATLSKPFDLDQLLDLVAALCRLPHQSVAP